MAISSYQATLSTKASTASSYTKLCPIKDFPDLIGEPNLLETTTLDDDAQTFIPGIKTSQIMTFTINWDETDVSAVQAIEGDEVDFKLAFSDGTEFAWSGIATLGVPGKGVDEVLEGTINIAPTSVVTVTV